MSDPRPGAAARRGQRCADRAAGAPHRAAPARRDGHPGRGHRVSSLGDGLRLATGTLTVLPVPPPRTVGSPARRARDDTGTARRTPARRGRPRWSAWAGDAVEAPPLLTAALAVAVLALGSGFLHLDGLADTADGLAVQGDRGRRLEVMRRGDVGPVGVVVLVLVLLVQVSALAGLSAGTTLPRGGRESRDAGGGLRTGSPTGPRGRAGERGRRIGAAGLAALVVGAVALAAFSSTSGAASRGGRRAGRRGGVLMLAWPAAGSAASRAMCSVRASSSPLPPTWSARWSAEPAGGRGYRTCEFLRHLAPEKLPCRAHVLAGGFELVASAPRSQPPSGQGSI